MKGKCSSMNSHSDSRRHDAHYNSARLATNTHMSVFAPLLTTSPFRKRQNAFISWQTANSKENLKIELSTIHGEERMAAAPVSQWLIYSVLGIPTVLFWAVVGVIAVKKDRTDRIGHEAQTVQSEFKKGKETDEAKAKSSHKWTVGLIYFGIFYEFYALSSFAFYPVIPWPFPTEISEFITYFRGQLKGLIARVMFWLVIGIYCLGGLFLVRNMPAMIRFRAKVSKCLCFPCNLWNKRKARYSFVENISESGHLSPTSPTSANDVSMDQTNPTSSSDLANMGDRDRDSRRSLSSSPIPLSPENSDIIGTASVTSPASGASPSHGSGRKQSKSFAVQLYELDLDKIEAEKRKKKENSSFSHKIGAKIDRFSAFLDSHLKQILFHLGFIPACTAIFRMASCKYDPLGVNPAYLNGDVHFICWDLFINPDHLIYLIVGLPIVYLLYPLALYRSLHINDEDPELRFLPRFHVYLVMFEFIQIFSTTIMISFPQIVAPLSAFALCGLATYNWYMQPALGAGVIFNHWRTGMLVAAAWSSVVSIIVVFVDDRNTVWPLILYGVFVVPLFLFGFFLSKKRAVNMEKSALQGLTAVQEDVEEKKALKIAETVANLALVEGYRHKLMTTESLDALSKLINRSESQVKCQALRAVANLSAEEVNREGIMQHDIVKSVVEALGSLEDQLLLHHAARTVFHLASVKTDRRKIMVDSGATRLLMSIMEKRDDIADHALYMCTKALMNVSTIHEMKAQFFDNQGQTGFSVKPLLHIASDSKLDDSVRKNALSVVHNLCALADNRDAMVYQGALEGLHSISRQVHVSQGLAELAEKILKILTQKNLDYRLRLQSIQRTRKTRSRSGSLARLMAGTEATAARRGRSALAKHKQVTRKVVGEGEGGGESEGEDGEQGEDGGGWRRAGLFGVVNQLLNQRRSSSAPENEEEKDKDKERGVPSSPIQSPLHSSNQSQSQSPTLPGEVSTDASSTGTGGEESKGLGGRNSSEHWKTLQKSVKGRGRSDSLKDKRRSSAAGKPLPHVEVSRRASFAAPKSPNAGSTSGSAIDRSSVAAATTRSGSPVGSSSLGLGKKSIRSGSGSTSKLNPK